MFFIIVSEDDEKKQKKGKNMKIQHLAIIFVLIMIPISYVLSTYVGAQITAIQIQSQYDTKLYNATYDAIKAFQINTINNKFSSISDSKIRDIYASANTFYNSLSTNFKKEGFTQQDLHEFTPALVYTLYDGYYIYGEYENTEKDVPEGAEQYEEYEYALKPMIYYSCRYQGGNYDIVVNYTLDNYITIMGQIGEKTITKSGYFINPGIIQGDLATQIENAYKNYTDEKEEGTWEEKQAYQLRRENRIFDTQILMQYKQGESLTSDALDITQIQDGITLKTKNGDMVIKPEILTESLLFADATNASEIREYQYVIYDGQKYYMENGDAVNNDATRYFQYDTNYEKMYISPPSGRNATKDPMYWTWQYLEFCRDGTTLYSTTAMDYYLNAYIFSNWVVTNMSNVSIENAKGIQLEKTVNEEQTEIVVKYVNIYEHFQSNLEGDHQYIFRATRNGNDPEADASDFQEHRRNVIRYSIETNLATAIANFNLHTTNAGYQYVLPVLNEEDWEKVTNNICVISFMQGMPVNGYKYYNNYSVLTNNKNKEFIGKNAIYLVTNEATKEKHLPGCTILMGKDASTTKVQGYNVTDFMRQNIKLDEDNMKFFYQHYETSCYNCILGANRVYDTEEIFQGLLYKYQYGEKVKDAEGNYKTMKKSDVDPMFANIRTAFMTALAREKQSIVKTMGYFGT